MDTHELTIRRVGCDLGFDLKSRPTVRHLATDEEMLAAWNDGDLWGRRDSAPKAFYNALDEVCFIGPQFTDRGIRTVVVAHEMFHHVQHRLGLSEACFVWGWETMKSVPLQTIWEDGFCDVCRPGWRERNFGLSVFQRLPYRYALCEVTADLFAAHVVGATLGLVEFPPELLEVAASMVGAVALPPLRR